MMRNIWLLVQNYIRCALGSLKRKKNRAKNAMGGGVILALFLGLGALLFFQAWSIGLVIKEASIEAGVLPDFTFLIYQGLMVGLVLLLFFSLQNITGGAKANDADLLLSMPFTKIQIVAGKAFSKYLINLAIACLFTVPYMAAYFIYAGLAFSAVSACLIVLVLLPFMAVGLNFIFDYLTTVLFKKSQFASIARTVFSLLLIIGFLGVWIYIQMLHPAMNPNSGELLVFPPISWLLDFVLLFDIMSLVWILSVTVLPFVLGVILLSTTLDKQSISARRKSVNIDEQKNRSPLMNVFLKEAKVYFNTPILMINTMLGVILIVALAGWLVFDKGVTIANLTAQMGLPGSSVPFAITLAFCILTALVFASCTSISLEGKSFWVIKTMPINSKSVLIGKALLNIVLVTPILVLSSVLLWFIMELTVFEFLLMLALPVFVNIFISFGGVFINLLYPKFDWESEQAVVKQSMATIMTTLLGFAAGLVPILTAVIFGFGNMLVVSLVCTGILAALAVGSIILTLTKGKSLYEKL